jgi:hypothetical protein
VVQSVETDSKWLNCSNRHLSRSSLGNLRSENCYCAKEWRDVLCRSFLSLSLTIWMVQLTFIVHHHHGFMSVSSTIRSTLWSSRFRSRHSNLWTSNFIIIGSILREIASRRSLDDDFWTNMETGFGTRWSSWWLLSTKTFLMFVLSSADLIGSWNELHTHFLDFIDTCLHEP